ncbi:MAG: hypothetical protein H6733_12035 [Alphaproteobacteria bacterium]|nr:hypothetical protein [Alphaproteobacteria bacterium]
MTRTSRIVATFVAVSGCQAIGPGEIDCTLLAARGFTTTVTGSIQAGVPSDWVTGDLTVKGTMSSDVGIASATLGGVAVTNGGFNFDTWSATVPIDLLRTLPVDPATGTTRLELQATTVCPAATVTAVDHRDVLVTPVTGRPVGGLEVEAALPTWCYLPVSGAAEAILDVCADADADGASVSVTVVNGTLDGPADNAVVLDVGGSDVCAEAGATVYVRATAARPVVTVRATAAAPTLLRFDAAGSPTITAPAGVPAGATRSGWVATDGTLASCRWFEDTDGAFTITLDGEPPVDGVWSLEPPTPTDCASFAPDAPRQLQVHATSEAPVGATATLTCTDVYGQRASLPVAVAMAEATAAEEG